ncbi:MAG TPA: heme o synthase [Actinomycetaceae bacterium]|nr:heme o synthase [Actinomycetaceae bacterium]
MLRLKRILCQGYVEWEGFSREEGPITRWTVRSSPVAPNSLTTARPAAARTAREKARGYVELMKLRIIELLLITTVPTMVLAERGWPGWGLVASTLVGGTLAAGAANAWNMICDRDIDAVMNRTKNRPLVTGVVSVRGAIVFSSFLTVGSLLWFGLLINWMTALFALLAMLIYVVGYTMILKRRTPQNIVWGGIAGCMPVLIGWSAVTGSLDWPPLLLFLVVFFWTPPHYWPLSIKFKKDYARAGVPMAPVVQENTTVAWHMIVHSAAMVASTLILIPVAPMGWIYSAAAVVAGAWFLGLVVRLYMRARHPEKGPLAAMKVFHGSIYYLSIVFLAVGIDPFGPQFLL